MQFYKIHKALWGLSLLLIMEVAQAALFIYKIPVTSYDASLSAYDALLNGAFFIGVNGPNAAEGFPAAINNFSTLWQHPGDLKTAALRIGKLLLWEEEIAKSRGKFTVRGWLTGEELTKTLIMPVEKFRQWYITKTLCVLPGPEELVPSAVTDFLELIKGGGRLAILLNTSSTVDKPLWVALGILKKDNDFHVCLMDSVGGVFDSPLHGSKTALMEAVEKVLAAAGAGEPAMIVPPHPGSVPSTGSVITPAIGTPHSLGSSMAAAPFTQAPLGGLGNILGSASGLPTHQTGTLSGSAPALSDAGAAVAGSMATAAASSPLVGTGAAAMPVGAAVDLGGALCRVGLVNQGGTCYQNSVLQALHKSFYFRQLLARILSDPSIETDAGDGSEIIRQLRDTFVGLGQNDLVVPPGFLNPFYNPVSFAAEVVDYMGFESLARHQDAQEFMTRLFGLLQLKKLLPDPTLKDYDRTADDFNAVEYQEELTCKICGYRRMSPPRPDFTYLLSLSIPAGGSGVWPVEELLRAYRNIEDMGERNLVACEPCNAEGGNAEERLEAGKALQAARKAGADDAELVARVEAMRGDAQTTFGGSHPGAAFSVDTTFPFSISTPHTKANRFIISPTHPFLILQIKRFFYDKDTLQRGKFVTPIIFPADGVVAIEDSDGAVHRFSVVSAVVHLGSLGGGHYWCVAADGIYNDTSVTLDGGAALRELLISGQHEGAQGYLYFLERVAAQ